MKTILSDGVSCRFRNMGVVCAILVVAIHVQWPHDTFSVMWLMQHVVKHGIATSAVPFFFVASGFFLTRHMHEPDWYGTEIRKRIYSLVIPFVVWTIISIILVVPLSVMADVVAHRPLGSTPEFSCGRWVRTIGLDLRDGPRYLTALWYVRCLFCFVVFAPLFKCLVLKGRCVWLALCFALVLCTTRYTPPLPLCKDFSCMGSPCLVCSIFPPEFILDCLRA